METPDQELLAQYSDGNVDALELLVERYRRPLYGYILGMTRGREDADEIFQEVWFRAIKKLGSYRQKSFSGWLVRIAHNLVIDRGRRRKPDMSLDAEVGEGNSTLAEVVAGDDPAPDRQAVARELAQHIDAAVSSLPSEQREVFLMRSQSGLTFKEIAKIQKVSINTALARMHYALAKLRPQLVLVYEEMAGA